MPVKIGAGLASDSNGSRQIRVLVIGARGIPDVEGGAEKNAEYVFPRVVSAGYSVTLVGLSTHIQRPSFSGVKLTRAPAWSFLRTDKLLYYVVAIGKAIATRPDIIHLQGLGAALFLWVYKLLGFRVVVRYGSADYVVNGKWGIIGQLGFRFCEYQLRFADAIISVAPSLTQRLGKRGIWANVHQIPNALDPEKFESNSETGQAVELPPEPYIVALGRVTAQKNILVLLKAFAELQKTNPHVKLFVAGGLGDTRYVNSLRAHVGPNVQLLGNLPRPSAMHLLRHCALYVNVSIHEGNSNATLEAVSNSCPVLVSDISENRDMALPQNSFVSPSNPSQIAAAMERALTSPADYIVDPNKFMSWQDVADRTIAVYRELELRYG